MILREGKRVYNTETAKLILNLPNGFKGYRKSNGEFFFEFQGRLGICNEDFYKCIGHQEPQDTNSVSDLDKYKIDEFEKRVKEEKLSAKEIFNQYMVLKDSLK
jgi:hypothetical protein